MDNNREQRCQPLRELLKPYLRLIAEHRQGKPPINAN